MGLRFGFASLRYDMSMKCRVPAVLMVTLLAMLTAPVFAGKPPALYSFRTDGVRPGGLFAIWSPEPFIPVDKLRYPPFALAGENGQTIALSSRTLAGTRGNRDDMLRGVFLEVPADCPAGKYDLLCADKPTGFPVTILPAAPMEPIIKISPTDGDDAAALNKILEENKDKHATILFSPGVYRWKSQIKLPPATTLTADCQGPVHIVCSVPTPETWSIQLTAATDYGKIYNPSTITFIFPPKSMPWRHANITTIIVGTIFTHRAFCKSYRQNKFPMRLLSNRLCSRYKRRFHILQEFLK